MGRKARADLESLSRRGRSSSQAREVLSCSGLGRDTHPRLQGGGGPSRGHDLSGPLQSPPSWCPLPGMGWLRHPAIGLTVPAILNSLNKHEVCLHYLSIDPISSSRLNLSQCFHEVLQNMPSTRGDRSFLMALYLLTRTTHGDILFLALVYDHFLRSVLDLSPTRLKSPGSSLELGIIHPPTTCTLSRSPITLVSLKNSCCTASRSYHPTFSIIDAYAHFVSKSIWGNMEKCLQDEKVSGKKEIREIES